MEEKDFYVPSRLDDPPRMLFWEMDEFIAAMFPVGIGIITGLVLLGGIAGILTAFGVKKLKAGSGRNIIAHAAYWFLPSDMIFKLKRTPPSHIREWLG